MSIYSLILAITTVSCVSTMLLFLSKPPTSYRVLDIFQYLAVKVIPGNCLLNNSLVYCMSFLFVVIKVERLCTICTMLVGSLFKTLCSRVIWS